MNQLGSDIETADEDRWNSNIEYHALVARSIPDEAKDVLDIGCGEGMLSRRLRRNHAQVTGIDADPRSIDLAREQSDRNLGITYLCEDFNDHPFADESFDAIVSVATLHHLDARAGLRRMSSLLRPGGTLVVIGLARSRIPCDLGWEAVSALTFLPHRLVRKRWEHPSPMVWPPPHTYGELRTLSTEVLPGSRFRRHLQWRYSLVWTKPTKA